MRVPPELRTLGVTSMNQEELILNDKSLTVIPDSIGKLVNLRLLDLHGNKLRTIPNSIVNLKKLTRLLLSDNELRAIPNFIGSLKELRFLHLENNYIFNIPTSIGNLKNLDVLDVSYNELTSIPDSIGNLKELNTLYLHRNKLERLPDTIGNLRELNYLNLSSNRLRSIPTTLGNIRGLGFLDIRRNPDLRYVPVSIQRVRRLMKNVATEFKDPVSPRYTVEYKNQKLPNNGVRDAISYTNFNKGDRAMKITNAGREPTYMTVNTFRRLSNGNRDQALQHIYRRNPNIRNINGVFSLNGNNNVFVNPMTTKMVKRKDINFVKFV